VTQPSSRPGSPGSPGPSGGDWAAQAADKVEQVVATVREKTTTPILKGARGAIWGVLATFLLVIAVVLLYTALFRMLDSYLPWGVWATHLIFGIVFTVGGVLIGLRGRVQDDEAL
jgi:hypothetical protein